MNLALVFASRPLAIKQYDPRFFEKILRLLFEKKWASLEFASPSTLHLLYESIHNNTELGSKVTALAPKLLDLINN